MKSERLQSALHRSDEKNGIQDQEGEESNDANDLHPRMVGLEALDALREEHVAEQDREEEDSPNESKAGLHFGTFISTLNQFRERKGPNWFGVSCGHRLNIFIPRHRSGTFSFIPVQHLEVELRDEALQSNQGRHIRELLHTGSECALAWHGLPRK